MEFLYTLDRDSFPSRNFKAGKNLNKNPEYPYYPHKGMWLSPAIRTEDGLTSPWIIESMKKSAPEYDTDSESVERPRRIYTLDKDANLFHFRTVNDYVRAYGMFPLYITEEDTPSYYENDTIGTNEIKKSTCDMMDLYADFVEWKDELCKESDINDKNLPESATIDKSLRFYDCDGNDVLPSYEFCAFTKIYGYEKNEENYSTVNAIYTLKKMCEYCLEQIKHYSKCIRPSTEDTILGIDYNAMRSAGYKGIYIHQSALDEAKSVPEDTPLHNIIDPLLYWSAETICVWSYCFTD